MKNSVIKKSEKRPTVSVMKKRLLSAMCLIALTCACFAQDIIVTRDSRKIEAKVTEVNIDNVKYKVFDHQDGPLYTIAKSNIVSITYQNGMVDTFDLATPAPAQTTQARPFPPVNVLREMRTHYPWLYAQYNSGKKMKTTGWILTGVGIGAFGAGLGLLIDEAGYYSSDPDIVLAGTVLFVAGNALIGTGVPILIVGSSKKKRAVRSFNQQYYSLQQPTPHFQLNVYPGSVGLAYVF